MKVKVKDLQKCLGYENIKGDLIGWLENEDNIDVDITKYQYYIVSHRAANINKTFTDFYEARRFALDFDAKNRANGYTTSNIDNIVGIKE